MARRRSLATREKDIRALGLRRRGLSYDQIAVEMGWRSASSAYESVQRALADAAREAGDEVRQIELERLDEMTRTLNRIIATKHYVVSVATGKLAYHPVTKEPLLDDGPIMHAIAGLLRVAERRAKLLGLDAPTKHEVITLTAIEAEIVKLEAEVAELGRGEAGPPALPAGPATA